MTTERQQTELHEEFDKILSSTESNLSIEDKTSLVDKVRFLQEHNSYLGKVSQFMRTFRQKEPKYPTIPKEADMSFRIKLILEELRELGEACGLNVSQALIVELNKCSEQLTKYQKKAMNEGLIDPNPVAIGDALADLQYVLSGAINTFGMKNIFNTLFEEVHDSNMSKLCITNEEAEETLEHYKNQGIECIIKPNEGYFIVMRKSDEKVLKSINYKPARLETILEKA